MITTIKALAHVVRLLAKHRDLAAVQTGIDHEREWFKFCARHALDPGDGPPGPPADIEGASITYLVADDAHLWKGPDLPDPYQ